MQLDLTSAYLRWALFRAALARGWWNATALYLVLVADLSPSQLVLIGVFQGLTVVVAEVPAGVLADAVSRRLALVVAHVVMGAGMAMTGFVTASPLLVVSQCLWGLGWAISSGADMAWITDELDRFDLIHRVLTAQGRFDLIGTAVSAMPAGTRRTKRRAKRTPACRDSASLRPCRSSTLSSTRATSRRSSSVPPTWWATRSVSQSTSAVWVGELRF